MARPSRPPAIGSPPGDPDWAGATADAVRHLQQLIRINTVNPPGNELPLARYLAGAFAAAEIEQHLLEPSPGRASVVARLRGAGTHAPVLLLAHMDVVGVEAAEWSVDPFGGVIDGGYLYGRGAIDDKGMLAVNLQTMLLLKRHLDAGGSLRRDVIFAATADEETGGEWGLAWLLARHPELLRAEFALNEGGRIRVVGGGPLYAAVQTAEKVSHTVRVTSHGTGGHGAVPVPDNAILHLARALAAIGAHVEPVRLTPTTRRFFRELGRVWPDRTVHRAMADVASSDAGRVRRGAAVLANTPVFGAVLRTGISPTMIEAGIRANVIPESATAVLDLRTLPGQPLDGVLARLRRAVRDRSVDLTVLRRGDDAPPSSFASPMFEAIAGAVRALDSRITVVPYLSTGATDSARLRRAGIQAFGLLPFPLADEDERRMHAHDERVPLTAIAFGVRLVHGIMARVAA